MPTYSISSFLSSQSITIDLYNSSDFNTSLVCIFGSTPSSLAIHDQFPPKLASELPSTRTKPGSLNRTSEVVPRKSLQIADEEFTEEERADLMNGFDKEVAAVVMARLVAYKMEMEAFAHLLQAPHDYAKLIIREQFPMPRLVVCDQHGSQARFMLAKLDPSATYNNAPAMELGQA